MSRQFLKLVPIAAALAMTFSASAADVTIYGKVDTGLAFTSVDSGRAGSDRVNTTKMLSGQTAGSRWGIRGDEDLGNGYSVGFKFESGINTDDGSMAQGSRLFGRQVDVHVGTPMGMFKIGHMGALGSGFPDTGLFGGNISPFAVGLGEVPGHRFIFAGNFGVLDNAITYISPSFAGFRVHAQYSFGVDTKNKDKDGIEGESSVDRFYALGLSYNNARTEWNTVIDSTNYASYGVHDRNLDDSLVISTGVRHDIDVAKLYFDAQYFKNARDFTVANLQGGQDTEKNWLQNEKYSKDGYGVMVGADIPAFGAGTFKVAVGYMHAELSDTNKTQPEDLDRYTASFGYWHALSKRTTIYSGIGYMVDKLDTLDDGDCISGSLGVVHNF